MIIAMMVLDDQDDDDVQRALVVDLLAPNGGIICHKENDCWTPVWLVQEFPGGAIKRQLPPCFQLAPEASEALENPWVMKHDSGEVS